MPTKLEWMSLVCRIVKVFFPSTAAAGLPCKTTMAPVAAEAAKISRRVGVFIDMIVTVLQAGLATNIAQSASYKLIKIRDRAEFHVRSGSRLCENLTDAMIPLLNRGGMMKGFVQGADRQQTTLLPECLDDWVDESNPVRAVDVFVDALELRDLGFDGVDPAATGRPAYHPSPMLKLYIYGYLNRVQSSRRLEREAGRNLEVMWLTGRLVPDHKTIADFRKDNGPAIKKVCAQFVALCRKMGLLAKASVAIDGSKFKAANSRDNNVTQGKIQRRQKQIEESVARYMSQLDIADRRTAAGEDPLGSGAADQDAA